MPRDIKNVFVDWISLVSKNNTPSVEQAENKFALFKTVKKDKNKEKLEKIQLFVFLILLFFQTHINNFTNYFINSIIFFLMW